jgi:hypothetical protein
MLSTPTERIEGVPRQSTFILVVPGSSQHRLHPWHHCSAVAVDLQITGHAPCFHYAIAMDEGGIIRLQTKSPRNKGK